MVKKQNFGTWIHSIHKNQMILINTLQKMLKLDLILQIRNEIDHWIKEKKLKAIWINKR